MAGRTRSRTALQRRFGSSAGTAVGRVAVCILLALGSLGGLVVFATSAAAAATFANAGAISVADATFTCGGCNNTPGLANPYPSNISVSGMTGNITGLTVSLNNISYRDPNDLDFLLVGPGGQKFVLMSDVGGFTSVSGVSLTLDDAAASALPTSSALTSGTFRPTSFNDGVGGDAWPSPAPAGPYSVAAPEGNQTLGTVFNGTSPNGTWGLYITDDSASSGLMASIAGGWSMDVTVGTPAPTATTVTSSSNPSTTGNAVTFTAHVTKSSDSSNATSGTVTFKEGTTTLANNVALNGSGNASFTTSALPEGSHVISAFYNGDANFATSNGSVNQVVDNATTVNGGSYCNPGVVTLTDAQFVGSTGTATPYPSHISVSGANGSISKVSLTAKNVTEPLTDDLDLLLVGPAGQKFVVASDAGGLNAVSNATVTFDDDAVSVFADNSGGWGSGTITSRPVNYNDGTDIFPAPAPSSPLSPTPTGVATFASVFGGASPNGTWSLYAVDDSASSGSNGAFSGGWCLNITTTNDPATTTTVSSSTNPSDAGSPVTFTAHVTKAADSSNVTVGSVTFRSDGNLIGSGPVSLGAGGTASVSTSSLSEGTHTITALYGGSPGAFNLSTGSLSQQVDSSTVVSGTTFCNNGGIQINDPASLGGIGAATPYPSHISVTGTTGNLVKVTATVKGLTHTNTDDIDVLLVSPSGTTLKLMSDAGGFNGVANANLTFDDAAASLLPDSAAISAGTYKPTDYTDAPADTFPSPAPAGPYGTPAPTGSGTLASFAGGSANGTWSLYVVDDALGSTGSISGWCVNLTLPPVANDDAYAAAQDTALTVPAPGVLANDTGTPAPTAVALSGGSTSRDGTVNLAANGGFSYTPPAGFTGIDTFTYTATNGPGATDTATVTITVTHKPSITGATVTRQQGSPASTDTIATVSDVETPDGDLAVTANPPTGVAVSTIQNSGGTVTADVQASCAAVTGPRSVPLTVTDGDGLTNTDDLTVDVTANTAPTLAYDTAVPVLNPGFGTMFEAVSGPTDNGSVTSLTIHSVDASFTGTVTVDGPASGTPGRVHVNNAGPAGVYTVVVRASDNCGAVTDAPVSFAVHGAPTVDAGPDDTITLPGAASLSGTVTTDGLGSAPTLTWSKDSGPGAVTFGDPHAAVTTANFDTAGVYTLRLTADDGTLTGSDTVQITVQSTPTIHIPADITVTETSPGAGAPVPFTVTADGFPTPSIGCVQGAAPVQSGDTFASGVHTIDCTATNAAGQDFGSFTITVRSVPVIEVPADITVTEASPGAGAAVTFTVIAEGTPTPSVHCVEGATAVQSGDSFAAGVHTIDCTATNAVGSDSGSFTITVRSVPVIQVPADFSAVENPQGSGTASVPFMVTTTGVPTATIVCKIGATTVTSPVTLSIGSHTIDCTATNSVGSDSGSFVVTVNPANHPPVADGGGPYSVAEGASLTLNAGGSSDADGDPLTYSWDVNGDGTFGDATGVHPTLTWNQLSALGINDGPASFSVTVQVSDGHVGGTVTSSAATLSTSNTAPTGGITGPGDVRTGTSLSLSFSATDPSAVDQAAGFDYTMTWGDGATDGPLHAGSPLTRSHTYPVAGVYTVTMVATDKDGGTSMSVQKVETVAGTRLLAAVCGSGTDLVVGGTSGADTIKITPGSSTGSMVVTVNGVSQGAFTPTSQLIVYGQGGNDTITVDSRITIARLLYGGDGDDTISGGNGNGVQVGGDGNDSLSSGNGRDILIAGTGADTVNGGNGDDILLAGSTTYDAASGANQRALCSIAHEWQRTDASYTSRVAHLGGSQPGGLNGTNLLTTGPGRTAFDDYYKDRLTGGLGQDWYLLNKQGGSILDQSDAISSETKTDL